MPRFRNPWQLEQQKNVASPIPRVTTPGFFRRIWRSVRMKPSRLLAIGIVSSVLIAALALGPATQDKVLADNNAFTFQGQYTAPACGPRHDFTIGPNTRTIDVVAS